MSGIPDVGPDDLVDTAPPDPGAVARRILRELRELSDVPNRPRFDDLPPAEQFVWALAVRRVLEVLAAERA